MMYVTFPLGSKRKFVVISAYGPADSEKDGANTRQQKRNVVEGFWEKLQIMVQGFPTNWPMVLLGDLNARVSNHLDCTKMTSSTKLDGGRKYTNLTPVNTAILESIICRSGPPMGIG